MKPTKTSAHSTATLARRLQTRLRYEKGLSNFSQALFLHALSAEDPLPGALKHLLHGTEASRVAVFENFEDSQAGLCARRICAVAAPGLNPPLSTSMLQRLPYHSIGERWRQTLAAGHSLQGPVFEFPAPEQALLQNQNILSLLVLPIFLGQSWFGFIVFDDCLQARTWSGEDVDLLRTASQILGAYFSQRRMQTLPVEDVEVRSGPLTLRGTTPRRRPPLDATAELLIAAERVLKEEKGFRQDFDPLQDGIFLVDLETAKFAAMNPAALDLYGFSNSEITMLGLTDISCGPQDALDLRLHVDKNPAGRVTPMHQRQKEGSVILVEIVSGTCTLDGKKFLLAAVREGEEEQGRISGRIEFSSEISGLPQNARHPLTDVEEILNLFSKLQRKILASTQSEFSFAGEGIYNDPAHPFLRVLAFARADHTAVRAEESMPEFKGLAFHHLDAVMTQMHQSGKPFLARCPEEAPFIDRLPAGHPPIRALLGLPIFHDNRLTGMIGLANRPGGYSSDIIQDLRPHVDTFGHLLQEYRETRQRLTMGAGPERHRNHLEDLVRERTAELVAMKEKAERGSQAKTEFLSKMSHELRTPLNAILGFGQLLDFNSEENLTPTQQEFLHHILRSGKHLLNLINEILDLSRIESGKIPLKIKRVNLSRLVEEVVSMIHPMARERKIQLVHMDLEPHPLFVSADPVRLKQVLINLMSNGIKYNRENGHLETSIRRLESGRIQIRVKDSGLGISPAQLKIIFEPFNRLGADRTEIPGTGIGLTITKSLVELMKGTIHVESAAGHGSLFILEFPDLI